MKKVPQLVRRFRRSLNAAGMTAAMAVLAAAAFGSISTASANSADIEVGNTKASNFSGTVTRTGTTGPASVAECATVNCDHFRMHVDLPAKVWSGKPGGVQVTITWKGLFNDIAGLAVYQNGHRVALSNAAVATFQSVRLNMPTSPHSTPNGNYDIYVAYNGYVDDNGVQPSNTISYTGWVQVQYEPAVQPVRDLIPNVIPLPTTEATFASPAPIFGDSADPANPSCFQSEVAEHGVHKCLRVQQRMYDQNGPNSGPIDIRFSRQVGTTQDEPAMQRIYRSDGTYWDRPAGNVVWHPVHQHYHYEHYTRTDAFAIDAHGNPVGAPAATGEKNGFCLADTDVIARQNQQFVAPMVYTAPDCLSPRSVSADGQTEYFGEGEGPGNGDTYDANLPDQFIDADNLQDGVYLLQTVVDPDHKLLETNTHDNCIAKYVKVWNMNTSSPQAQLLDSFNGHPAPACAS